MNIIENKKKIAIIGKGTAGSLTLSNIVHHFKNQYEIEWYFDPSTPTQSVGEGSTLPLPHALRRSYEFSYNDFDILDATIKTGIRKVNWNGTNDYIHHFPIGSVSMHFNATKLQEFIFQSEKNNIKLKTQNIRSYQDIDATQIIDCSGAPKNYSKHNVLTSIPVNTAYIQQCPWDIPKFNYTLTISRPYGWVFGIPLQDRCSIGYLFNSNFNSFEEVQEDIKNIFKQFNLNPTGSVNKISFKNYYKKENYIDRVAWNGNASFFLEPMEANAIGTVSKSYNLLNKILYKSINLSKANFEYNDFLQQVESMICIHYYAGSKYNTPFWKNAQEISQPPVERMFKDPRFLQILESIVYNHYLPPDIDYGQWSKNSWKENILNLNLLDKLKKLV